jgi:uracil-DNA glycosylase family 4
VKRPSSRTETYWGRPIPGWGGERPRVLIAGLAPAANGGNRTGRIFTGDRSGDVLFASLHRCGLAALPTSTRAGDGQRLLGARMVAAVRCAPPANKPSVTERDTCAPWLAAEFAHIAGSVRVIVCLGGFAWQAAWSMLRAAGFALPRPRPAFGHGAEVPLARPAAASAAGTPRAAAGPVPAEPAPGEQVLLMGCYHPSQQNTFTGRVTPAMLDDVFRRASAVAGLS